MLKMLGSPRRFCDGLTRRESLQVGAISALGGFGLPQWLQAATAQPHVWSGKAKNVICLYLLGGAPWQDMYDLKPEAPADIRGEFRPIHTDVPGIDVCEHLPRLSQWMHRAAIIRSVNHKAGCHNCLPSYTGWELTPKDQHPHPTDPPSMGAVCEYLKQQRGPLQPGDLPD